MAVGQIMYDKARCLARSVATAECWIKWATRRLLSGTSELPAISTVGRFASIYRQKYLGETRSAVEGLPQDTWDELYDTELVALYHDHHPNNGDESDSENEGSDGDGGDREWRTKAIAAG
jgi:hypothetical protein